PQRDDDCAYIFTFVELSQRVNDDRRARDLDELFRGSPAESAAAAGGGNDCYVHGSGWWLVVGGRWSVDILATGHRPPTPNPFLNQPMEPAPGADATVGRGNRPSRRALLASGLQRVRRSFCPPWSAGRWLRPYRHFYR